MKRLGDITKINGAEAPVVDVIIGGSPCQDLSVAGKQAGLAGERSGLFMEQVRIVKEMRVHDAECGRTGNAIRPRFMVWENVPGAFSSNKGEDFRAVLEEIAHIVEEDAVIPGSPKGRWSTSGCIMGEGWSVAWRVFDAQFWGVPQRRRRICLVADFGGYTAPEILFVRESLCGDTQESGAAGKAAAAGAGQGPAQPVFCIQGNTVDRDVKQNGAGVIEGVSYTLDATDRHAVAQPIVMASQQGKAEIREDGKALTLTAAAGTSGNNQPVICMATGQDGAEITRDLAPTLNCDHEQPIVCLNDQGGQVMEVTVDKTGTLRAQEHGHQPLVFDARGNGDGKVAPTMTGGHESSVTDYSAVVMAFNPNQGEKAKGLGIAEEQAPALGAEMHTPAVMIAAVDCRNGTIDPAINGTLQAKPGGGTSLNLNNVVMTPEGEAVEAVGVDGYNADVTGEVASTLGVNCGMSTGRTGVLAPVSFDFAQVTSKVNQSKGSEEVAYSLAATGPAGVVVPSTFQNTGQGWWNQSGVGATLRTPCGGDAVKANLVVQGMVVRRLTPMECERLQGYPDLWTQLPPIEDMSDEDVAFWQTAIMEKGIRAGTVRQEEDGEWWRYSKGEKVRKYAHMSKDKLIRWYNRSFCESSDGARYKALGNSIALPPWKWVLKRLCAIGYERDATMASLFDGIGGFPLIWEQINGKGSCQWASEIEEFPIAVTKFHFGDDNDEHT